MERTTPFTHKIAVLTSGNSRGSNLRAMASLFRTNFYPIAIDFVVYTKRNAPIVQVCAELGIEAIHISSMDMHSFETRVLELCLSREIELIALAGFLKLLSPAFCQNVGLSILNIHPSLLPKHGGTGMYGMKVHHSVYEAKDSVSGATVHLADPIYDHGEILAQKSIDISTCNTPEEIASKVLSIEHSLYGETIFHYITQTEQA